jgi:hypothetical protein
MNIRCNKCYWAGIEDELKSLVDDDGYFLGCPKCETDAYLMDFTEGECDELRTIDKPQNLVK